MALRDGDKANFETLKRAAANGDLALVECKDAKTGEYRAVICAIGESGSGYIIAPFGHLAPGNPYDDYTPPD